MKENIRLEFCGSQERQKENTASAAFGENIVWDVDGILNRMIEVLLCYVAGQKPSDTGRWYTVMIICVRKFKFIPQKRPSNFAQINIQTAFKLLWADRKAGEGVGANLAIWKVLINLA